ncbi:YqaA family protein [Viridibacterium curvum]|uniref:YqaA family protein n=1 Tax=Viridibacterium curvum TaxID=1101404 RepID=A0ABP9QWN4_9RHOO
MESLSYPALFIAATLAATVLPVSSEVLLGAMLVSGRFDAVGLLIVASAGNTLGAVINWCLGRYLLHFRERRWFPLSAQQLARAEQAFQRYGLLSLLFAWVPVVGDPLTLVAGVLRVRFWLFLLLVGIGKTARYGMVLAVAA